MRKLSTLLAVACVSSAVVRPAQATVIFENTGTLMGWSRVYVQHQGTNTVVSSPTFEGSTAIKSTQTFIAADGSGYHSERVMFDIQRNGQDYYYGLALYLPPDWTFHDQNVTFQQWAYENPGGGGPWILMFVQNDKLRMGGSGASGSRDIGTITNLRGTWIRIVTRINMTATGPFEVWVNGAKTASVPINLVVGGDPPTIRWSTGIYCTAWRTQQPAGGSPISVWHDHLRVATTYAEANPANWGNPSSTDAGTADGLTMPDAPAADAPADSGSAGAGGGGGGEGRDADGMGGAAAGGAAAGGSSGTGGAAGAPTRRGGAGGAVGPPPASGGDSGCGCTVGSRAPAPAGTGLLVLPIAAAAFAWRRARRARSARTPCRFWDVNWSELHGVPVIHLLDERRTERHRVTPFARREQDDVVYEGDAQLELPDPVADS